jgi:ankyrin repeat protein
MALGVGLQATGDQRLLDASKGHNVQVVRALVREHADVNAAQPDGTTALHWAAHWNDVATADLLLQSGANVNAATDLGVTALFLACENGSATLVEHLLAARANPNPALPSGETALMTASRSGNEATVKALLSAGAHVNDAEHTRGQTALMWAAAQHHPAIVRLLLAHGADVTARSQPTHALVNRADPFNNMARRTTPRLFDVQRGGFTALLFAARSGDVDSATALIDAGAAVDAAAADGTTPLIVATHSGQSALALRLLEKGADPNIVGAGYTAMHAAALRGDVAVVKALLARGARPNDRLLNGTAMTRYGQDYALPDAFTGATPLFITARFGEVVMTKDLLAAGADPNMAAKDGTTPLMLAAGIRLDLGGLRPDSEESSASDDGRHATELATALLDAGADAKAVNDAGDTALHGAAAKGWRSLIELLVKRGADVNAKNKRGQTPLAVVPRPHPGGQNTADVLRSLGATQ